MNTETIRCLNRLLALHCRSFPSYVQYSRPYVPPGRGEALATLAAVALDQDLMAQRISRLVSDGDAPPQMGEFPMEYAESHDLDIDFVLQMAVRYQQQDIAAIEAIIERLPTAPAAKAAAEESLGMAKGHLESLTEAVGSLEAPLP